MSNHMFNTLSQLLYFVKKKGKKMETIILTTIITASISSIIGTVIATIITIIKTKSHGSIDNNRAIMCGISALLWRELKNLHAEAMINGGLDVEERRHLENVYKSYHCIGGNGTGTRLYNEAIQTKVKQ